MMLYIFYFWKVDFYRSKISVLGIQSETRRYIYVVHFLVALTTCTVMVISYYKIWRTIRRKVPGDTDEHGNRLVESCKTRVRGSENHKKNGENKVKLTAASDVLLETRRTPVTVQNTETSRKSSPNVSAYRDAVNKNHHKDEFSMENENRIAKIDETRFSGQPKSKTETWAKRSSRHNNQSRSGTSSSVNNIATMVSNRRGSRSNRRGSKSTKICAYISVVYILLSVPSITTQLMFHSFEVFSTSQTFSDIMLICYIVSLWNTVSNPLVYAVLYRNFWLEITEICIQMRKFFSCCCIPLEPQSRSRPVPYPPGHGSSYVGSNYLSGVATSYYPHTNHRMQWKTGIEKT